MVDAADASIHGDVLIVAHGHILRALAMRWAGKSLRDGPAFLLEAGGVGTLRYVAIGTGSHSLSHLLSLFLCACVYVSACVYVCVCVSVYPPLRLPSPPLDFEHCAAR